MLAALPWLLALVPRYELDWEAPPPCPGSDSLEAAIEDALGPSTTEPDRRVIVDGEIKGNETDGYELDLAIDDDGHLGRRALRSPSCTELADTAALLIAMAVDPRLVERMAVEPEPTPVPVPIPEPNPEPTVGDVDPTVTPGEPEPRRVDRARPPPAQARPKLSFVGLLGGGIGSGALPALSGALGLDAGIEGRFWRAVATVGYWTPRAGGTSDNPDVSVRAQLWTVGARGCGIPRLGSVAFPLCLGAEAGLMHARGTGDLEPLNASSPWAAVTFGPGVTWWILRRFGLGLHIRGHAAVARPEFTTDPSGRVHRAGAIGVSALVTIEFRTP